MKAWVIRNAEKQATQCLPYPHKSCGRRTIKASKAITTSITIDSPAGCKINPKIAAQYTANMFQAVAVNPSGTGDIKILIRKEKENSSYLYPV